MATTKTAVRAEAAVRPAGTILEVKDLKVEFRTDSGKVAAVNEVSFELKAGEIVGIVGESGSGKSQILMSLMGLLAKNGAASGSVKLRGQEILGMKDDQLDKLRGASMSMIFQDPMTSLNPFLRVSTQLTEVLVKHRGMGKTEAMKRSIEMLDAVSIPDAAKRIRLYPHEFSGGMRQRVMISMALLCQPAILFADEPTTALDVTVQAQILDLMKDLAADLGTTVVLVTHDLGVVASLCDRVIVLYGGRIMESGPAEALFADPKHPYTRGLLASTPRLDEQTHGELHTIPGQPPAVAKAALGCPFEPRCTLREPRCKTVRPIIQDDGSRTVACHVVSL
ncbi:MAG TPA: ABC transporter ATP-binding protein [Aliidongia sp.]|uniref:ABC transporter ATP-binding protein n=1 Tax=Aliidongia sp. TaxID=1914230 RepID=UPI002DDD2562|nr:ABC transporter ATP-binding protein [Aliidongia sp.]HEV2675706.1 ABC transporter ATP-binding protein [Aliidongia sp.]